MIMVFSVFLSPPAASTALSFSCGFSGPGHRRRQKEGRDINRNGTNYKADVLLYDGGRTVSRECRWYFHYLLVFLFCCLKFNFRLPRLSDSLTLSSLIAMFFY